MRARALILLATMVFVSCRSDTPVVTPTSEPPSPHPTTTAEPAVVEAIVYDTFEIDAATNRRAPGDIWRFDVETDTVQRVVGDPDMPERSPRFAGGGAVLYLRQGDDGRGTVWRVDEPGGAPVRVVGAGNGSSIQAFDVSPDAATIAVLRTEADGETLSVRIVTGETSRVIKRLTVAAGRGGVQDDEIAVRWSPDGTRLLVVYTPNDFSEQTLWVLDTDGIDVVTPRFGTFGRWSPDGEQVYYRRFDRSTWWSIDISTGRQTELAIPRSGYRPTVSPDGSMLAYDDGQARPMIYVFDLEGGTETEVGRGLSPIWLSDERVVATRGEPCEERYPGDPDQCALSPPWVATGPTMIYPAAGGRGFPVSLGSTFSADTAP